MNSEKQAGGVRAGSGRKPLDPDAPTVPVMVKMSTTQRDKLKRLGGAPWVRQKIDKASEPKK